MAKERLDVLGEVCPIPLLMTQGVLAKFKNIDVLVVETDSNQAARNILNWCESCGFAFEIDDLENGVWEITIKRE